MLNFCKGLLADGAVMQASEYGAVRRGIQMNGGRYLFELAAMELYLLYDDVLYTKAAVVHAWHGVCVRVVAPLSAAAAFVLFQLSSKDAYVAAMALELAWSLRAAGSSWACASFHARGWHRLCGAVMRLRRTLKSGARRRACLDLLGQYNLLDLSTDANRDGDLRGKVARMIGLGDRWQKLHYSSTVPISDGMSASGPWTIDDLRNARGRWILKERGMYEDLARVADDTELDRSITVWHIATDLYLSLCPELEEDEGGSGGMVARDDIRVLSNHMLFLMVVHPYLLPGRRRSQRQVQGEPQVRRAPVIRWVPLRSTKEGSTMKLSRSEVVKKIAERQLPADSMRECVSGAGEEGTDDVDDRPAYADGAWLAGMLLGDRWRLPAADLLRVVAGVWVEMLCYASHHCGEEAHAMKLSTGAEFMNAVWLVMGHATLSDRFAPSAEALTGEHLE
ncbi:hypothetical protein GQ55_3G067300 [Panicum hallii var. hallii]|uniref:DUF4220 domain-containing protein n=1 Tax=Panicum hallii var. hallii TaxID=1504633 RepID=A0A2T7E6G3_9POAL|nr:hypothetical protein GQ55_3G067300 [Panicum hallii var. hallii]